MIDEGKRAKDGQPISTGRAMQQLERRQVLSLRTLIEQSVMELGKALPAHMSAQRLARIAQTALSSNPQLMQCQPRSVLAAIFQCASLGLEPVAGSAWIIPYRIKGVRLAQFQVGAYGWVELFYRHQAAVSLHVETVRASDRFAYDLGANTLTHQPPLPLGAARGEAVGYYAVARMTKGGMAFKVIDTQEARAVGERFSKCWDPVGQRFLPGTPWAEHFDAMAQKTVIKRLVKTLPKSIEIQRALDFDETVKTRVAAEMVEVPDESEAENARNGEDADACEEEREAGEAFGTSVTTEGR